jgi:hypothetical protein
MAIVISDTWTSCQEEFKEKMIGKQIGRALTLTSVCHDQRIVR